MTERLYFRQLLSGRDFAQSDPIAQQMRNFSYLIGDRETGDTVVVDPAYAADDLVDILESDGMKLSGVLVTHHHPDHVGGSMMGFELKGLAELLERQSVPVHVNSLEAEWVSRVTGIALATSPRTSTATRSMSATSRSSCCTPPATLRAASASCSTAGWSPATRCSSRAAAAPTSPAATSTRCSAACSSSPQLSGRPDGVSGPLVFGGAQRNAVGGAAHQLRLPGEQSGSVANADGRLIS